MGIADSDESFLQAVYEGDRKEAESLLNLGANIESRTQKGSTALIVASARSDSEITRLFLDEGANWDIKSKAGWTAFKVAFKLGKKEVALQLMEAGANK